MQNENWKESLRNLAADELRNIRSFVDELIQESEAKATIPHCLPTRHTSEIRRKTHRETF